MSEKRLWLETDYFEDFHCKGGSCRNSCCEGWQIAVGMKEYFELIGRDCSSELHRRLECAFTMPKEPSPQRFRVIAPNWLGRCPLHGEDGLCMLHKELGEDALPEICRVYPRSMKNECGVNQACCSGSCEAVVEMLMNRRRLHLRLAKLDARPEYSENTDEALLRIGAECMWLLQDDEGRLKDRIAAICTKVSGREFAAGDDASAGLRVLVPMLQELKRESASLNDFGGAALARYADLDGNIYLQDIAAFGEKFPDWERWFENLIANHLIYADFPFVDGRIQIGDACTGLCLIYAAMRVLCAAYCLEHPTREDMADVLSGIFRLIEHSAFYYNAKILIKEPEKMLGL